ATTPLADAPLIGAPAWDAACAAASALPPADAPDATEAARAFFARWFRPHHLGDGDGLMTGYYEPEVRGALAPDARFRVALHARPPELVDVDLGQFRDGWRAERVAGRVVDGRLAPMPARAAIETGALAGRGLELVWLDDAVDAFFLHIQGSGRVRLPDGSLRRIGYAGANGHRYTAIGRVIADESALAPSQVSMQSIRAWLAAHPDRAAEVMRRNASYVFFRWRDGDGPVGTAGTTLVAGRSLAVDPRFVPLGAPVWVETMVDGRPFRRLMIAEDTGGAIRGAGRGDIFIGGGEAAGETAGRLRATGRLTVLLPAP
ncbi:MAG: murein transglycosylase, partial [Alphaproteobacteria bacterium]|nr:murein transglycosylase [Alphaproteobacteria bacterium]